jgi:uracil-DNA glycosylase family 4
MEKLKKLYTEIHNCHICPAMDREKALRDIKYTNLNADVFIVAQALASNTLRKSGINFYKQDGTIGNTGKQLEKFLNKFNRTVNPDKIKCVYNTEIAQCYPGKTKNGKGDRKPSEQEMKNCLKFLIQEIEIIKPKIILLMGKSSRDAFYKYILNKKNYPPFSAMVGCLDTYDNIPVMPIQHASGANPGFLRMLKDISLVNKIKEILTDEL